MPQILWIGCLESDEEFKIKAKKGYDLASAQVSQKNLLNGIEEVSGILFDSINGSVLPPYPVYKDRIIKPVVWKHKPGALDISVGYKNDKYISRVNCKTAMIKAADKWVDDRYKNKELIVFVYSMRSAPMATACHIKKRIPQAKIYLIVTDLPQFMDLGQSKLKAMLKQLDWKGIKRMQQQFDGFILYASKMAEFLEISYGKWMLMEGSYDVSEGNSNSYENTAKDTENVVDKMNDSEDAPKKTAVMYSGKLDKEYGIPMLLDAFMQIDDKDVELWLTGGGNAEDYINECVKKDSRIKFYGFLPSREDVLKKQKAAMLLVNMRLPSETASAYCFPSKLFEYMATGVPVLSFKLEGIPEEYYEYLIGIDKETTEDVAKTIKNVLEMPEKRKKNLGKAAKEFIIKKKNRIAQCERIWHWIQGKT